MTSLRCRAERNDTEMTSYYRVLRPRPRLSRDATLFTVYRSYLITRSTTGTSKNRLFRERKSSSLLFAIAFVGRSLFSQSGILNGRPSARTSRTTLPASSAIRARGEVRSLPKTRNGPAR